MSDTQTSTDSTPTTSPPGRDAPKRAPAATSPIDQLKNAVRKAMEAISGRKK